MISLDRRRGALWGLAIGDALGSPVEFEIPGTFFEVTGFRAGGAHGQDKGEWTDDTSMALALADSIAEVGWDLGDQADRYLAWWQQGAYTPSGRVVDIGTTTLLALQRYRESGDPWTSGDSDDRASGNGSIMRLAPVAIAYSRWFPDRVQGLIDRAVESSLPTHASPKCLSACVYLNLVLCGLIHGRDRQEVLDPDWPTLTEARERFPIHPEILEVAAGSYRVKNPPEIIGAGYVVKSLEAALWAFHRAENFREAVLKAVNLGNDADTIGAIAASLPGLIGVSLPYPRNGAQGLPSPRSLTTSFDG